MSHQEIYDFFIKRGASPHFQVVDSPFFEYENKWYKVGEMTVNLKDFIDHKMNDTYKTIVIYSNQDLHDGILTLRFCELNIPSDIPEYRQNMINKILSKINKKNSIEFCIN
jgi:hypothetical protein